MIIETQTGVVSGYRPGMVTVALSWGAVLQIDTTQEFVCDELVDVVSYHYYQNSRAFHVYVKKQYQGII